VSDGNASFARIGESGLSSLLLPYLHHVDIVSLLCASKRTQAIGTHIAWRALLARDFPGFVSVPPACPCGNISAPEGAPLFRCLNCDVAGFVRKLAKLQTGIRKRGGVCSLPLFGHGCSTSHFLVRVALLAKPLYTSRVASASEWLYLTAYIGGSYLPASARFALKLYAPSASFVVPPQTVGVQGTFVISAWTTTSVTRATTLSAGTVF
jgi:hypothetical protein